MKHINSTIIFWILLSSLNILIGQVNINPSAPKESSRNNYSNNKILTDEDWYHTESHKKVVLDKTLKDLILINRFDGVLECYDKSFQKKWSFKPADTLRLSNGRNQFYFNDGIVYTAYMTGYIYALDAKDGSIYWESKIGMDKEVLHLTSQSLIPNNNRLFLTSRNNQNTYAIDATTGELVWNYSLQSPNSFLPYLSLNKNIYISSDPLMNIFDAQTGELLHQVNFNQNFGKLVTDGKFIITSFDQEKKIVALHPEDLSRVWDFKFKDDYYHVNKKILVENNRVYIATESNKEYSGIYCLNTDDGTLIWENTIKGDIAYIENLDNTIYGYTEDKTLFYISLDNMELRSVELKYKPVSNLEKSEGNLYFYSKEGLVRFNLETKNEEVVISFENGEFNSRLDSQIILVD